MLLSVYQSNIIELVMVKFIYIMKNFFLFIIIYFYFNPKEYG